MQTNAKQEHIMQIIAGLCLITFSKMLLIDNCFPYKIN